jgi:DNA-binding NarL/FixJ family response regulator
VLGTIAATARAGQTPAPERGGDRPRGDGARLNDGAETPHYQVGLVVEDQGLVCSWLVDCLVAAFPDMTVSSVGSLRDARAWTECHLGRPGIASLPAIVLVDLGLPDGSGVDLIGELAARAPGAVPVVTTVYDDDGHVFDALAAGAQGYLLKDQTKEAIVAAIRAIARGEPTLSPSVAHRILRHFRQEARPAASEKDVLTAREVEVLTWLGRGLTVPETARRLGLSEHTTASYVKIIYSKLNISSRAQAAIEAQRRGLI